jgi:hypothetical protein
MAMLIALGVSDYVQAQEIPTTPAEICSKDRKGEGTFNANVRTGTPTKMRRLRDDGTVEIVTVGERSIVDLRELSTAYVSGSWSEATKKATDLLNRIETCLRSDSPDRKDKSIFNLSEDYVHLLWVSTVPAAAEPSVFSMLVHSPELPPYSRVLPGLSNDKAPRLFEVFLTENLDATLASYYVSKPLPDPLLDQVPQVVEKFLGPLFTLFDRIEPTTPKALAVDEDRLLIHFKVRQVRLPEPRAGVEVTMRASLPITQSQLRAELTNLAVNVQAQGLSKGFESATSRALQGLIELAKDRNNGDCGEKGSPASCKRALHETITSAFNAERQKIPADPRRRDLDRLEAAFHTFVDNLKQTFVTGKAALDNSPLTHLTFGLLTSYAFWVGGDDLRAKVDGGKVVNAPLPRALNMVVLNMSLRGYQSKTNKRWIPEAFFQPFVGVVFSPDFGVSGGASFKVMSNLGVNVGYAHLFIARPEDGLAFGAVLDEKVKDANGKDTAEYRYSPELRKDPLQSGQLHAIFLGVSYNFK